MFRNELTSWPETMFPPEGRDGNSALSTPMAAVSVAGASETDDDLAFAKEFAGRLSAVGVERVSALDEADFAQGRSVEDVEQNGMNETTVLGTGGVDDQQVEINTEATTTTYHYSIPRDTRTTTPFLDESAALVNADDDGARASPDAAEQDPAEQEPAEQPPTEEQPAEHSEQDVTARNQNAATVTEEATTTSRFNNSSIASSVGAGDLAPETQLLLDQAVAVSRYNNNSSVAGASIASDVGAGTLFPEEQQTLLNSAVTGLAKEQENLLNTLRDSLLGGIPDLLMKEEARGDSVARKSRISDIEKALEAVDNMRALSESVKNAAKDVLERQTLRESAAMAEEQGERHKSSTRENMSGVRFSTGGRGGESLSFSVVGKKKESKSSTKRTLRISSKETSTPNQDKTRSSNLSLLSDPDGPTAGLDYAVMTPDKPNALPPWYPVGRHIQRPLMLKLKDIHPQLALAENASVVRARAEWKHYMQLRQDWRKKAAEGKELRAQQKEKLLLDVVPGGEAGLQMLFGIEEEDITDGIAAGSEEKGTDSAPGAKAQTGTFEQIEAGGGSSKSPTKPSEKKMLFYPEKRRLLRGEPTSRRAAPSLTAQDSTTVKLQSVCQRVVPVLQRALAVRCGNNNPPTKKDVDAVVAQSAAILLDSPRDGKEHARLLRQIKLELLETIVVPTATSRNNIKTGSSSCQKVVKGKTGSSTRFVTSSGTLFMQEEKDLQLSDCRTPDLVDSESVVSVVFSSPKDFEGVHTMEAAAGDGSAAENKTGAAVPKKKKLVKRIVKKKAAPPATDATSTLEADKNGDDAATTEAKAAVMRARGEDRNTEGVLDADAAATAADEDRQAVDEPRTEEEKVEFAKEILEGLKENPLADEASSPVAGPKKPKAKAKRKIAAKKPAQSSDNTSADDGGEQPQPPGTPTNPEGALAADDMEPFFQTFLPSLEDSPSQVEKREFLDHELGEFKLYGGEYTVSGQDAEITLARDHKKHSSLPPSPDYYASLLKKDQVESVTPAEALEMQRRNLLYKETSEDQRRNQSFDWGHSATDLTQILGLKSPVFRARLPPEDENEPRWVEGRSALDNFVIARNRCMEILARDEIREGKKISERNSKFIPINQLIEKRAPPSGRVKREKLILLSGIVDEDELED
ncbi:unnamed protein product [Amoebophrya sp. A120]|nr:unnamed protein product [Amoebophrya sp. A120]|eukprot:GSA120T00005255001.1